MSSKQELDMPGPETVKKMKASSEDLLSNLDDTSPSSELKQIKKKKKKNQQQEEENGVDVSSPGHTDISPMSEKKKKKKKVKKDTSDDSDGSDEQEVKKKKKKEKKAKKEKSETKQDSSESDMEEETPKKEKKEKILKRKAEELPVSAREAKKTSVVKKAEVAQSEGEEGSEILNPYSVSNFRVSEPLKLKLKAKGIEALFAIQALTFDGIFEGKDLVGRARTGQVCSVLFRSL